MYIKYKQVEIAINRNDVALDHRLNTFNIWCGFVASFGLTFVANFQETNVRVMHFIGALMAFGVGSIYFMTHVCNVFNLPFLSMVKDRISIKFRFRVE